MDPKYAGEAADEAHVAERSGDGRRTCLIHHTVPLLKKLFFGRPPGEGETALLRPGGQKTLDLNVR